jgi:hypothetical protein
MSFQKYLPVHGQTVDNNWMAEGGGTVAESFYQNQNSYGLGIS